MSNIAALTTLAGNRDAVTAKFDCIIFLHQFKSHSWMHLNSGMNLPSIGIDFAGTLGFF
jgi:hypothetical protein